MERLQQHKHEALVRQRRRLWAIPVPRPEREALKVQARAQGLSVRAYCSLVLRNQLVRPRALELLPVMKGEE
jgi:hypothetical protein